MKFYLARKRVDISTSFLIRNHHGKKAQGREKDEEAKGRKETPLVSVSKNIPLGAGCFSFLPSSRHVV
jgi:hypothetical protein